MSNKPEENKTVLVELDCLLDTRLGTVERINPAAANRLYLGDAYYERDIDDWATLTEGVVDNATFQSHYAARDAHTLELSRPTRMLGFIKRLTQDLDASKVMSPEIESVHVVVNVHPYTLSERECEVLETLVYSYCAIGTKVTTTSLAYEAITPETMETHFDGVVLYEFDRWFTLHAEALNQKLIPRNSLFSPALYIKPPEALKKETPEEFHSVTPFAQLEMAMVERLGLELFRVKEFSVVPFGK